MAIRRSPEGKPVNRSTAAESDGKAEQIELPLRVTLVRPPSGVQFCVQGKTAAVLEQLQVSTGEDLSFDFTIRVAPGESGSPRFLGPYTHGPPSARFVYLCVGTLAGQADSCWTRRVKIPLSGITMEQAKQIRGSGNARLAARVWGTGRDGGPVCAGVKLLDDGWRLME